MNKRVPICFVILLLMLPMVSQAAESLASMVQRTPAGSNSSLTTLRSSADRPRSISLVPKPRRDGGTTGGRWGRESGRRGGGSDSGGHRPARPSGPTGGPERRHRNDLSLSLGVGQRAAAVLVDAPVLVGDLRLIVHFMLVRLQLPHGKERHVLLEHEVRVGERPRHFADDGLARGGSHAAPPGLSPAMTRRIASWISERKNGRPWTLP